MNSSTGPAPLHALMKGIITGIPKLPQGLTSLSVLGTTYTMPQLAAKLGTYEATYASADAAELAKHTALEARNGIEVEAHDFVMATTIAFKAALGRKAAALEVVGIAPDKVAAPLTAEQKVQKAAKASATRKARHTMGPKAKSKVKGQVPAPPPAQPPKPGP